MDDEPASPASPAPRRPQNVKFPPPNRTLIISSNQKVGGGGDTLWNSSHWATTGKTAAMAAAEAVAENHAGLTMTKTLAIKNARDFATVPPRQRWTKGRLFQEKALESWSVLEARARRWLVQKGIQPGVSKLPRIRAPWAMRTAKGRLVRNHKLLALAYRGKGALSLKVFISRHFTFSPRLLVGSATNMLRCLQSRCYTSQRTRAT